MKNRVARVESMYITPEIRRTQLFLRRTGVALMENTTLMYAGETGKIDYWLKFNFICANVFTA